MWSEKFMNDGMERRNGKKSISKIHFLLFQSPKELRVKCKTLYAVALIYSLSLAICARFFSLTLALCLGFHLIYSQIFKSIYHIAFAIDSGQEKFPSVDSLTKPQGRFIARMSQHGRKAVNRDKRTSVFQKPRLCDFYERRT